MIQRRKTFKFDYRLPIAWACAGIAFCGLMGCGTTTTRTATEQLLISDALDNAVAQIDFGVLEGKKVFVDTVYLKSVKASGFVNSDYIISSLRQQLTASQCLIQDKREDAEIIVEPRVGALGTDGHEVVYGIPQSGSVANAAAVLTNSPIPTIPEISIGKSNAQTGIAKVIVFAYDRESRQPVWQSGVAKSESTSRDTWYLGAGPFQKGTIHEGTRFAGRDLPPSPNFHYMAESVDKEDPTITNEKSQAITIPYHQPFVFKQTDGSQSTLDPLPASGGLGKDSSVQAAGHVEGLDKD